VFPTAAALLGTGRKDPKRTGNAHGFLLRGLVHCGECKSAMTSSTTSPRGKPYRYYVCTAVNRRGTTACPVRMVSAPKMILAPEIQEEILCEATTPTPRLVLAIAVRAVWSEQRQRSCERSRITHRATGVRLPA